jgi:hypothetical protein
VDREPLAMSLLSGDRVTATTAHSLRLVFSISDWTTAACVHKEKRVGAAAIKSGMLDATAVPTKAGGMA